MRMLVHASCAMFFLVRSVRTEVVMLRPWPMYQSDMAAFGIPHKTSRNSRLLDARAYVASFELLDSERLIWTSPPDAKGKVVFAVMQVDTHETEKVINMQRFVNHVHSVTCGASQTHISFVQHEAFQAAVDAWSWVNLADAHLMHVISYWKDCLSPEGNFKPFHFTKMSTEALTRTIILEGTEQEWAKALHSWTLELGDGPDEPDKPFPPPPPGAVMEESAPSQEPNLNRQKASWRSTFGDISKYGWNVDHSRTLVANLNSDFGHTVAPKVALNDHGYQGFWVCHKCFTSGTVTFRYRFHMRFFILLESDVWMTMQNVGAGVEWEVGLYAENTISIEYLTKAWKFSLGVSGVNIPGVANIGMYVQAAWGIGATKFRGRFNVTGAMALHIPNGSKVHIDFMKGKIDRGDFKYIYYKNSPKLKGVAEGTLYANTILGGGSRFEIFGHTLFDIVLQLRYPELGFEIAASRGGMGPCGKGFKSTWVTSVRPYLGLHVKLLFGPGGSLQVLQPINGRRDLTSNRHSRIVRHARHLSDLALTNLDDHLPSLEKRGIKYALAFNIYDEQFYLFRTQCFGTSGVPPPAPLRR